MNNNLVEVKALVDVTKPQEVKALNTFLGSLGAVDQQKAAKLDVVTDSEEEDEDEAEKAAAKKRSEASRKAAATKKANAEKAKVVEEDLEEDSGEEENEEEDDLAGTKDEEDDITYDMLSDLLAAKVGKNRVAIKEKLAACKAAKMSELDEKYYAVMHSFLTKLKA